jgi:hypothetical protein
VALIRTDVSEERITSIIRVRIGELRLLVPVNIAPGSRILDTLMMEAISSFAKSVLTRATRSNIQEDCIIRSTCFYVSGHIQEISTLEGQITHLKRPLPPKHVVCYVCYKKETVEGRIVSKCQMCTEQQDAAM